MSANEEYFINLLLSLGFVEDYEPNDEDYSNDNIICYMKREIKFLYYIKYNSIENSIHFKSYPITSRNNLSTRSSSYKTNFDNGITDIKFMYRKEIRLLKISKLLNEDN